jgi:magnesium transporter
MAELDTLTHAYFRAHPADAARELERRSSDETAAVLLSVPVRLAAPVFGAMLPYLAARCLRHIDMPTASRLLMQVGVPAAAAVLRHLPQEQRTLVLEALPATTALATRALLRYAEDSVGALVDSEIVAMPPTGTVADALAAVREARVNANAPVYVVDAMRRPLGEVPLATLLRAESQQALSELMRNVSATLPALTSIAAADQHRMWASTDVAPVVERGGALIGVIERRTLHSVQRLRARSTAVSADTLPSLMMIGYWEAVAGLIEALLARQPAELQ